MIHVRSRRVEPQCCWPASQGPGRSVALRRRRGRRSFRPALTAAVGGGGAGGDSGDGDPSPVGTGGAGTLPTASPASAAPNAPDAADVAAPPASIAPLSRLRQERHQQRRQHLRGGNCGHGRSPRATPFPISAAIPTRSPPPIPRVPAAIDPAILGSSTMQRKEEHRHQSWKNLSDRLIAV